MPKPKPIKPEKYSSDDIQDAVLDFLVPRLPVGTSVEPLDHDKKVLTLPNGQQFTLEITEV